MQPTFSSFSLRARITGTIAVVLLPLAAVVLWAVTIFNHSVAEFDRLVASSAARLDATVRLQYQVLNTGALLAHEHQSVGARRVSLSREVRAVDNIFRQVLRDPTLQPHERGIVQRAQHEWRAEIRQPPVTAGRASGEPGRAAHLLGTLANTYRLESDTLRRQLEQNRRQLLWMVALAALACLATAATGTTWLTRSVLRPLRTLKDGVAHFADNDLSYRLPSGQPREFSQLAIEINRMAEHLEVHQSELQELSARDPLTGLFNRREFSQRLQAERERGRRYQHPFSLLMIDVDHFKDINDRHGHAAGDEVLITIADLLRLSVRPMDIVCRHGGEEFAVLLPETENPGAAATADRVRRAVADSTILVNDEIPLRVTVSIGLASFTGAIPVGADPLALADQALYRAKREGRNRVVSSTGA